jgi:hypothetical protein
MSEKCGAPNDKLLDDDTVEVYHCDLDLGHLGPHKSLGYPMWWNHEPSDEDLVQATIDDYNKIATPLATRALKAMLPDDAAAVADVLDGMVHKPKGWLVSDCERENLLRAVEILRGAP